MNTVLPLTEARNKFAELIDDASKMFSRFTITRNGKPEAVLMSKDEYDALIDTLEILSNPVTMASIRRGEKDIKAGRVKPLEDVLKDLKLS
ncbi:MAG: type II toxin-antitoxin system Phd/YefM family antitoxin [Candidatus Curtissbacteria bacterium]|nr:type II toxin-antitoxin system Phd/YefM family antitoxin [Candidatus Curtissbacteria bacterium]